MEVLGNRSERQLFEAAMHAVTAGSKIDALRLPLGQMPPDKKTGSMKESV